MIKQSTGIIDQKQRATSAKRGAAAVQKSMNFQRPGSVPKQRVEQPTTIDIQKQSKPLLQKQNPQILNKNRYGSTNPAQRQEFDLKQHSRMSQNAYQSKPPVQQNIKPYSPKTEIKRESTTGKLNSYRSSKAMSFQQQKKMSQMQKLQ